MLTVLGSDFLPNLGAVGITYLLRDEFTTDRAAGAVNGTAPEPGPASANRTLAGASAATNVSISGGKGVLVCAAASDPYWSWGSYTRTAGRILKMSKEHTSANNYYFGWAQSLPTFTPEAGLRSVAAGPVVRGSSTLGVAAAPSNNTQAEYAMILRATGCQYYRKSGSNWLLLWVDATGSTATLTPYMNAGSVASVTISMEYVRIPTTLWLGAPLASDGFGSTFGTTDGLGHAETTGVGSGGSGLSYTQVGTWANSAGKAAASALSGGVAIATVDTGKADAYCAVKVTRSAGVAGGVTRYVDIDNHVRHVHNGTQAQLIKRVAGTDTTLLNVTATYSAGAEIVSRGEGTAHRLYYNSALIGSQQTVADAALVSATRQGLYTTDTGNTLDALVVYAVGSGGEHNILDTF